MGFINEFIILAACNHESTNPPTYEKQTGYLPDSVRTSRISAPKGTAGSSVHAVHV